MPDEVKSLEQKRLTTLRVALYNYSDITGKEITDTCVRGIVI